MLGWVLKCRWHLQPFTHWYWTCRSPDTAFTRRFYLLVRGTSYESAKTRLCGTSLRRSIRKRILCKKVCFQSSWSSKRSFWPSQLQAFWAYYSGAHYYVCPHCFCYAKYELSSWFDLQQKYWCIGGLHFFFKSQLLVGKVHVKESVLKSQALFTLALDSTLSFLKSCVAGSMCKFKLPWQINGCFGKKLIFNYLRFYISSTVLLQAVWLNRHWKWVYWLIWLGSRCVNFVAIHWNFH